MQILTRRRVPALLAVAAAAIATIAPATPAIAAPTPADATAAALLDAFATHQIVRITDCPAVGPDRRYLVERGLHRKAELDALIADYLHQAQVLDGVPMSTSLLGRDHRAQAAQS